MIGDDEAVVSSCSSEPATHMKRRRAGFSAILSGKRGGAAVMEAVEQAEPCGTGRKKTRIDGPRDHSERAALQDTDVFGSVRKDTWQWLTQNIDNPQLVCTERQSCLAAIAKVFAANDMPAAGSRVQPLRQILADLCLFYASNFGSMDGVDLDELHDEAIDEEIEQGAQRVQVCTHAEHALSE